LFHRRSNFKTNEPQSKAHCTRIERIKRTRFYPLHPFNPLTKKFFFESNTLTFKLTILATAVPSKRKVFEQQVVDIAGEKIYCTGKLTIRL